MVITRALVAYEKGRDVRVCDDAVLLEFWCGFSSALPTVKKTFNLKPYTACKEPRPPLINSHSFKQILTNQKSRTVSSWLLIGLNLHKRM